MAKYLLNLNEFTSKIESPASLLNIAQTHFTSEISSKEVWAL